MRSLSRSSIFCSLKRERERERNVGKMQCFIYISHLKCYRQFLFFTKSRKHVSFPEIQEIVRTEKLVFYLVREFLDKN